MENTILTVIAGAALFFAGAATIDLLEADILHGRRKLYWLLVIWFIPFVGFLLYRRSASQTLSSAGDSANDEFCADDAFEAVDALLNIPDQD